ncbi:aldo/keto reductase [Microbacterium hatanonis]
MEGSWMSEPRARHCVDRLPPLGLGLAQLGNLYRETTEEEASSAIDTAWGAGIRYFDTAPHYGLGLSEQRAGRFLAGRPRDQFALSTKVGRLLIDNPDGATRRDDQGFDVPAATRREWDFSRDGIRRSIDASLARLGLSRIDIAYVHDPDDFADQALHEAIPALEELREQGVLRAIGVGVNHSALASRFVRETDIDLVMIAGRFTLLDQSALEDLLPAARDRDVGIVAAGVYNSGVLSAPRPPRDAKFDYADAPADLLARAHRIADICETFGVSLPEAAVAFPRLHSAVVSVVVGARNGAQAQATADRAAATVPDDLWRTLLDEGLLREGSLTTAPGE